MAPAWSRQRCSAPSGCEHASLPGTRGLSTHIRGHSAQHPRARLGQPASSLSWAFPGSEERVLASLGKQARGAALGGCPESSASMSLGLHRPTWHTGVPAPLPACSPAPSPGSQSLLCVWRPPGVCWASFLGLSFPICHGGDLGPPTNCLHLPGVQLRVLYLLSPQLACAEGLSHLCPPLPCEVRLMGLSNRRVQGFSESLHCQGQGQD